jgi:hypothetical protein
MKQNLNRASSGLRKKIIGLHMTPAETQAFFKGLRKTVVTFFGYSVDYEDEESMLLIAKHFLAKYSPKKALINIGATAGGIGAVYPLAKEKGFMTTGIVSSLAAEHMEYISDAVDHVCFVADTQWGGKLPNSRQLSPTSKAMVACSEILIGIGGGEVTRDELVAGKEAGKPVHFYPAEIDHEYLIGRARERKEPAPTSFWGAAHEVFGAKGRSQDVLT